MTRRALVLADESARHPFRRSLPPHVFHVDEGLAPEPEQPRSFLRLTARDAREFLMAYCACFLAVTAFIY